MDRSILVIMPSSFIGPYDYPYHDKVDCANSFIEAQQMIIAAEQADDPYEGLDISAANEDMFWEFLDWMERRGRKYPFSIHNWVVPFLMNYESAFVRIRDECRRRGFVFRD